MPKVQSLTRKAVAAKHKIADHAMTCSCLKLAPRARRAAADELLRPRLARKTRVVTITSRPQRTHPIGTRASSIRSLEHVLGGIAHELELLQHSFASGV